MCKDRETEKRENTWEEGQKMKVIARIHSDFPTKFGIPHQSGRIEALKARIILNRRIGTEMPSGGWKSTAIYGLSGNFQKR